MFNILPWQLEWMHNMKAFCPPPPPKKKFVTYIENIQMGSKMNHQYTKYQINHVVLNHTDLTNYYFTLLLRTLSNNFANFTWNGSNNYNYSVLNYIFGIKQISQMINISLLFWFYILDHYVFFVFLQIME